jgi:hypothetical protein
MKTLVAEDFQKGDVAPSIRASPALQSPRAWHGHLLESAASSKEIEKFYELMRYIYVFLIETRILPNRRSVEIASQTLTKRLGFKCCGNPRSRGPNCQTRTSI